MLAAMILSSLKSFSVLTYLPMTLTIMMSSAKHVHHQLINKVACMSFLVCNAGGPLWCNPRRAILAKDPPVRSPEKDRPRP